MNSIYTSVAITCILVIVSNFSFAQQQLPKLHVNPKWKECSFQIDPSLTQDEWYKFTKEAGLVSYYRSLTEAKPLGRWKFEVSLLQWKTEINDAEGAWNNTFVHPDSIHWLKEGPRLAVPGLSGRVGIADKLDIGLFFTKNPEANYGIYGGQIQYNIVYDTLLHWGASARAMFTSIYGPEDLQLRVYGVDFVASKELIKHSNWVSISPYAGISAYLSASHETTDKVNLKDEIIVGTQVMLGVTVNVYYARLGIEYNYSNTNTLSFKIGVGF